MIDPVTAAHSVTITAAVNSVEVAALRLRKRRKHFLAAVEQ